MFNPIRLVLIFSISFFIISCSEEYNESDINIINDTHYKKFSNEIVDGKIYRLVHSSKVYLGEMRNGEKHGKWFDYDEYGRIFNEDNYKDGMYHGLCISYYNGMKDCEKNYKEGVLHGSKIFYYKNGQVKEKQNYKDGKKYGKWISFYDNGKMSFERNYENYNNEKLEGKLEGEVSHYYENGQIKFQGEYGLVIWYGEDWSDTISSSSHKVMWKEYDLNEKLTKVFEYTLPDGEIFREEEWLDGKLIKTIKY